MYDLRFIECEFQCEMVPEVLVWMCACERAGSFNRGSIYVHTSGSARKAGFYSSGCRGCNSASEGETEHDGPEYFLRRQSFLSGVVGPIILNVGENQNGLQSRATRW